MLKEERMYHIDLTKEDIKNAKYAILPGDPGRVKEIAKFLTNPHKLRVNREYTSYLGTLKGENVLIISTGMGGPSTAICVEELNKLGVNTLIRVGTSGGMQDDVLPGDIIIANAAVRSEGTSKEYVPIEYPAVADFDLVCALKEAADNLEFRNHVGVVHCKDSFYGQHSPESMPIGYELENKWNAWIKAGVLASEMETASLYTVSKVRGIRSAAVLLAIWNQELDKKGIKMDSDFDTEKEIRVAINAIKLLIKKEKKNK